MTVSARALEVGLIVVYLGTLGAIAAAGHRAVDRDDWVDTQKLLSVTVFLAVVGSWRAADVGPWFWGLAAGIAVNVSVLVGTKFRPYMFVPERLAAGQTHSAKDRRSTRLVVILLALLLLAFLFVLTL